MIKDPKEVISERKIFDKYVYTPLATALKELNRRQSRGMVLDVAVPESVTNSLFVLFRHVATPNYEFHRFLSLADGYGARPLIWEYTDDKFTPNNPCKKSLGKMTFFLGKGKKGGRITHIETVIDFNQSNGKKISEVVTKQGAPLVEFHHNLFIKKYGEVSPDFMFDASSWFRDNGMNADSYYTHFLKLFLKDVILFENFMVDDPDEKIFIETVFLPAFNAVYKEYGVKPLIVSLEPTTIEGDDFWLWYSPETMKTINDIIK